MRLREENDWLLDDPDPEVCDDVKKKEICTSTSSSGVFDVFSETTTDTDSFGDGPNGGFAHDHVNVTMRTASRRFTVSSSRRRLLTLTCGFPDPAPRARSDVDRPRHFRWGRGPGREAPGVSRVLELAIYEWL